MTSHTYRDALGTRMVQALCNAPRLSVVLPPGALLGHLGGQLQIEVPALASIRALYRRKRTLYEHQVLARHRQVCCRSRGYCRLTAH